MTDWAAGTLDPAEVERVLGQAGVDRAVPGPDWGQYATDLASVLFRYLGGWTGVGQPFGAFVAGLWQTGYVLAIVVVASAAAYFGVLLHRWVLRRRGGAEGHASVLTPPVPARRDVRAWREELERRLAAGDARGAAEALWWWFACQAARGQEIERSCTSREIVARLGRPDLLSAARELDRLLYGRVGAAVPDVRSLRDRMDLLLA